MRVPAALLLVVLVLVSLAGCSAVILAHAAQTIDAANKTKSRLDRYQAARTRQDWAAALAAIREEVTEPGVTDPLVRVNVHVVYLGALADYAFRQAWDPSLDREARAAFEAGMRIAETQSGEARSQSVAFVNNGIGQYYAKTGRNGLDIPHLEKERAYWAGTNNTYMHIRSLDAFASVFSDVGEMAIAQVYRDEALAMAAAYFRFEPSQPTDPGQWLGYDGLLGKAMDAAAGSGAAGQLEALWARRKPIGEKYLAIRSAPYAEAAQAFAQADDDRLLRPAPERQARARGPACGDARDARPAATPLLLGAVRPRRPQLTARPPPRARVPSPGRRCPAERQTTPLARRAARSSRVRPRRPQ